MTDSGKYILAIDQSTSASKVMLFDDTATLIVRVSKPHKQFYPQPGFVEHDPAEIFENVKKAMQEVLDMANITADSIVAIAITNQRETSMIWDKTTGMPIYNAAVWQCQRGAPYCNELKAKGLSKIVQEKTGLLVDPYFSASKLRWIINNVEGAKEKASNGALRLGTMDSWLLWKLTGGKTHATDYSNASRTMLFNIRELQWDHELIKLFDLHSSMFPQLKYSDEIFGYSSPEVIFDKPIPIAGLIGDSHGALFGQNCFKPGSGKSTYGTGSSVMMNIGTKPLPPPEGLVTSVGFGCNKKIDYVFEGNIHCTGDTINWLKNELELIKHASETEEIARSVDGNHGVYMVPAFVGLGAPYWDNDARACIVGLSRDSKKAHVVRAALESIAYQVKDLVDLMVSGGTLKLSDLRVDGGPTKNNFLMQFQADMLQERVIRSNIEEVSALGATLLAGLAVGVWKDLDEIESLRKVDTVFKPSLPPGEAVSLYHGWKVAVKRVLTK
ncbi:MAG: glycerol kinase GlpK [Cyclobacteriaceae bacterium]|nr:glycerol kinase GlpK [Cyclobacteriaceae bacterium]